MYKLFNQRLIAVYQCIVKLLRSTTQASQYKLEVTSPEYRAYCGLDWRFNCCLCRKEKLEESSETGNPFFISRKSLVHQ